MHFDGDYSSKSNVINFEDTPVQTAILGLQSSGVEFKIEQTSDENYIVSCPYQNVESKLGTKRFKAEFDLSICSSYTKPLSSQSVSQ